MLDWETLVRERDEWVATNFPPYEGEVPGNDSLLGCIEELGELAHAHLKAKQGIRGSTEEHDAAAKDAIGDLVVYLLGIISAHNIDVGLPATGDHTDGGDPSIFAMNYHIGLLCLFTRTPNPPEFNWTLHVNSIIKHAREYCAGRYWDFEAIVMDTWYHVKARDWNAHREAGAPVDDPAMQDPDPCDTFDGDR